MVFNQHLLTHDSDAATDPHARKIRAGFLGETPHTADEMTAYFKTSVYGQLNHSSINSYYDLYVNKPDLKRAYDASATREHLFMFTATFAMRVCLRAVAVFSTEESTALPIAGLLVLILVLYAGFTVPLANIVGALRWLGYLKVRASLQGPPCVPDVDVVLQQPLRYALESLMVNEFHTLNGTCTTLVPSGPGYDHVTLANQACNTIGSQPGMATVPGDAFTNLSYGYSYSHLWRVRGFSLA